MRTTDHRGKANAPKKETLAEQIGRDLARQLFNTDPHSPDNSLLPDSPMYPSNSSTSSHNTQYDYKSSSSNASLYRFNSQAAEESSATPASSDTSLSDAPIRPQQQPTPPLKHAPTSVPASDHSAHAAIEHLASRYGRVSHMGLLDRSYRVFLNAQRTGALAYKLENHVAVVTGDPLCDPSLFASVVCEFDRARRAAHWSLAFMGCSVGFLSHMETQTQHQQQQQWTTMQFGVERVVDPTTNEVLAERAGKRIVSQCKQLLCPEKGGTTLGVYSRTAGGERDDALEAQLQEIYDGWRAGRNEPAATTKTPQAFITVYELFDYARLMTFVYTRGADGVVNGFAALRWIGACGGYHVDPCIAGDGAAKGTSDLLLFAAMALARQMGVSYLSLGYEPMGELGEVSGMGASLEKVTRSVYAHSVRGLPVGGKKAHHDKFRPDASRESALYLIFPAGLPGVRRMVAMAHVANISVRQLAYTQSKSKLLGRGRRRKERQEGHQTQSVESS
ncbi:protein ergS [Aspergillus candidus]|uniref:Phosphatidylglycerol lysyltransferase C-terminal domain-containing protein n=1 Tax=Aspergillus candidus TaxID=41067 RepID=A0A2I2F2B2_ASPCN|nr:hypothetical protein BDW47DRAFT_111636 [Aspergillus candidus]PLB34770.1 hypothetical protein BDW47DRAFT_111636 [Aspergillus candidus]